MPLTRRQRLLWITAGLGALFLVIVGASTWWLRRSAAVYLPGETVEGLTADLARSVPSDHPRVTFTDVTKAAGIDFKHFRGKRGSLLPEDMGSGAAWGDYDNDGWVDLAVANEVGSLDITDAERRQSTARVTLYHNNHDGTFTDVTTSSGIDVRGWAMAVSWADYDNDGYVDLLITTYGHSVLYHNNDNGTFTDRSAISGIGAPEGFWTGAAWGDYDKDGYLDLYVTGYVKFTRDLPTNAKGRYDVENPASINPATFPGERNLLFHNNGNGTFTDVTAAAGVVDSAGRGLAAAWVDFDEDGWPDLYVANDVSANALYLNLHNGTFREISQAARVMDYRSSMAVAVGDWNGDGTQDMFLTHWLAQGNALYDNQLSPVPKPGGPKGAPGLTFIDESDRYGLGQVSLDYVAWAASFIDYDNDGKLDLFVVNGSTLQKRDDPSRLVPMPSKLFWDRGPSAGFFDVSAVSGDYFGKSYVGRGAAFADYDNDGDIDVFVVNHDGPGLLLRNDGGNRGHWLQVELRGTRSNRQGIGAKLRVVAGGAAQVRYLGVQSPYLSQDSPIETFGLGALAAVDTLEVIWPSGIRQTRTSITANQRLLITEGEAGAASDKASVQAFWSLYRQATTERTSGDIAAASDLYAKALALNPNHEDVLYYYGSMRFALGDFASAERAWRTLATVNPRSTRVHEQLGNLFLCLDRGAPFQADSARAHYQLAEAINKEQTGSRLHLGEVALVVGEAAAARRSFDDVLRTHAQSAPAHFYLGFLAWKKGDAVAARDEFRRAASAGEGTRATPVGSGEGDTLARGGRGPAQPQPCGQLRSLSAGLHANDGEAVMLDRFRRLDSLLASRRPAKR